MGSLETRRSFTYVKSVKENVWWKEFVYVEVDISSRMDMFSFENHNIFDVYSGFCYCIFKPAKDWQHSVNDFLLRFCMGRTANVYDRIG